MMITKELDEIANLWNKTKEEKYKILWYKKLKLWNGIYRTNNHDGNRSTDSKTNRV